MTKDAKLEAGVDVLRDPITGRLYDVVRVWRGEDIQASGYMRGSQAETSALYGGHPRREQAKRVLPKLCPAHKGPLKESA